MNMWVFIGYHQAQLLPSIWVQSKNTLSLGQIELQFEIHHQA